MQEQEGVTQQGALCANHAAAPAVGTCARCGDFMCGDCVGFGTADARYCTRCSTRHLEQRRRDHLHHEASIRSVGQLYQLAAALYALGAATFVAAWIENDPVSGLAIGALLLALSAACFALGSGLRRLRRGARLGATALSAVGLLAFPFGTLINGYILYLLHSRKGAVIFSDEHRITIAATPHIEYRTPISYWVALFMVIALFMIGAGVVLIGTGTI